MTIRDESIRTLAEALSPLEHGDSDHLDCGSCRINAENALRDTPTLAADLDLGTAWRMARAALPEGWLLQCGMTVYPGRPFLAIAHRADWRPVGAVALSIHPDDAVECYADTPTESLVALTAALRDRAR